LGAGRGKKKKTVTKDSGCIREESGGALENACTDPFSKEGKRKRKGLGKKAASLISRPLEKEKKDSADHAWKEKNRNGRGKPLRSKPLHLERDPKKTDALHRGCSKKMGGKGRVYQQKG